MSNEHDKTMLTVANLMVNEKMRNDLGVVAIQPENKIEQEEEAPKEVSPSENRPRHSVKNTIMLAMALTSAMNDFGFYEEPVIPVESDESFNKRHKKKSSMNLTYEEVVKLHSLAGKEKKKYIKELKQKYKES